jgi:hypothetical protein
MDVTPSYSEMPIVCEVKLEAPLRPSIQPPIEANSPPNYTHDL